MKHEASKKKVVSSLMWKFAEKMASDVVNLVLGVVLARLLSPSDYGVIGIVRVYISISMLLITGGFSTALIQKKEIDEDHLSSIFYIYMAITIILYVALFFAAPFIATFYGNEIYRPVLRVLGIAMFPGVVNSIQNAVVDRQLEFKMYFKRTLITLVLGGITGLVMAYYGYGVWALVGMQLVNRFSTTIILWFYVRWHPKFVFSFSKSKELFVYGYKLLISNVITTIYNNMYTLVIGKVYDANTLGLYSKGNHYPSFIMNAVDGSIASVMLPTLSARQDDKKALKNAMRRAISSSSFLLIPMLIGLAIVAKPMIEILLGEKWLMCVPFLQLSCFAYIFWPMQTTNVRALQALGRSDLFLKLGLIKRGVGSTLLVASIFLFEKQYSIYAMLVANVLSQIIGCFIHAKPNKKLLDYGIKEQIADILPALGLSVLMAACVFPLKYLTDNAFILLPLQTSVGVFIYLLVSKLFKLESMNYLIRTFKELYFNRHRKRKN